MKIINFIFYLSIIPSTIHCSVTREPNLTWNIICSPQLKVQVKALSCGTYFIIKQGTICDPMQNREKMSYLLALSIA